MRSYGTRMVGYSGSALHKKLGVKEGTRLALLATPKTFARALGQLPDGVIVRAQARGKLDVIVFFATRRSELERRFPVMARALEPTGGLWVAYPKRASGVATDLTFEPVQEIGNECGLLDNKACPIDDTWTALRFGYEAVGRPSTHGA